MLYVPYRIDDELSRCCADLFGHVQPVIHARCTMFRSGVAMDVLGQPMLNSDVLVYRCQASTLEDRSCRKKVSRQVSGWLKNKNLPKEWRLIQNYWMICSNCRGSGVCAVTLLPLHIVRRICHHPRRMWSYRGSANAQAATSLPWWELRGRSATYVVNIRYSMSLSYSGLTFCQVSRGDATSKM